MKSKFNKKKIKIFTIKSFFYSFFIALIIFIIFFITHYHANIRQKTDSLVQKFSTNFDYEFSYYEINNLNMVEKSEIDTIIKKYLYKSIFLIPMSEISDSINDLVWVKNVNLSTNFKNKIIIEIIEHLPVGLYSFNNNLFYFSKEGKIIDKFNRVFSENFIEFRGKRSLKNANYFLNVIDDLNHPELKKIDEAIFINERRWNIKTKNGITIYASESNLEISLKNYIKLITNLTNSEINSINSIDLRNNEKAIIKYKSND